MQDNSIFDFTALAQIALELQLRLLEIVFVLQILGSRVLNFEGNVQVSFSVVSDNKKSDDFDLLVPLVFFFYQKTLGRPRCIWVDDYNELRLLLPNRPAFATLKGEHCF